MIKGTPLGKEESGSLLRGLVDRVFGYDFFIAYAWKDAKDYGLKLTEALTGRRFVCFLDRKNYGAGDDLRTVAPRTLRKSSVLILILSRAALASKSVKQEVEIFSQLKRKIIPIDPENLRQTEPSEDLIRMIGAEILDIRGEVGTFQSGPSDHVIEEVSKSFDLTRQDKKRMRWASLTAIVLLSLIMVGGWLAVRANEARKEANREARLGESRRLAALARNFLGNHHPLALISALEALSVYKTKDALDTMLAALIRSSSVKSIIEMTEKPTAAGLSPDESTLATGTETGTVILWASSPARELGRFTVGSDCKVTSLTFSPDGQVVAVAATGLPVMLWDAKSYQPIRTMGNGFGASVKALAFSRNGERFAVGTEDGQVAVWNVHTAEPIMGPLKCHPGGLSTLILNQDGRILVSGGKQSDIAIWDVDQQKIKHRLQGHQQSVLTLAFAPGDTTFASAGFNPCVILWDLASGTIKQSFLAAHAGQMEAVTFSRDGSALFSLGGMGEIHAWRVQDGQLCYKTWANWRGNVCPTFSSAGNTLVTGGYRNKVWLWDISRMNALAYVPPGHRGTVKALEVTKDGRTMISVDSWGTLCLWNPMSTRPVAKLIARVKTGASCAAISADRKMLAIGNTEGGIAVRDSGTGHVIANFRNRQMLNPKSLAFSSDGKLLCAGGEDGSIQVLGVHDRQPRGNSVKVHSGYVAALAFSPDGRYLASGAFNPVPPYESVVMLDIKSQKSFNLPQSYGAVGNLQFSPDSSRLAAAFADGTVMLWSLRDQVPSGKKLRASDVEATTLAFRPDGRVLATGDREGKICLWLVESGRPEGCLASPTRERLSCLTFGADGNQLVSGGWDGGITVWNVNPETWTKLACRICDGFVTKKYWEAYVPGHPYRDVCCDK